MTWLEQAVKEYVDDARVHNFSEQTIKNKRNFSRRLLTFLHGKELTIETARAYLATGTTWTPLTLKCATISMKALVAFLYIRKYVTENFGKDLVLPRIHKKPYLLVSMEVAEQIILAGTDVKPWYNHVAQRANENMRIALMFILHTGLRISEIRQLHGKDFILDSNPPQFQVHSKGGDVETLPLDDVAVELIRPIVARGVLFPIDGQTCNEALKRGCQSLKVSIRVTCHSLRHLYANNLNDNGIAPQKLQRLMRHKRFATTDEYYLHNNVHDLANIANSFNSLARRTLDPVRKLDIVEAEVKKMGLFEDKRFAVIREANGLSITIVPTGKAL